MFESVFGLRERWPRYTDFSLIFCSFAPVYRCDVATSCPGVRRLPFQNLQGSWKALNIFSYLSLLNRLLKTSWPSRQPPPLFLWNFALFLKNSSAPRPPHLEFSGSARECSWKIKRSMLNYPIKQKRTMAMAGLKNSNSKKNNGS